MNGCDFGFAGKRLGLSCESERRERNTRLGKVILLDSVSQLERHKQPDI